MTQRQEIVPNILPRIVGVKYTSYPGKLFSLQGNKKNSFCGKIMTLNVPLNIILITVSINGNGIVILAFSYFL